MSIGLYDIDFMTYIHVPFNLTLMKLAAYYKKKREVVVLAPYLEPERYQKMYVVKDYFDGNFYRRILEPNVIYSGHAFTKNFYGAMAPEIEMMKPDKYLYHKYDKMFCINKTKEALFKTMTNAEHIRLSLDNETIWSGFKKTYSFSPTTRAVIFHDYNLAALKDGYETVKEITSEMNQNWSHGALLGAKFPIQVSTPESLFDWMNFKTMDIFYNIQYNNLMSDELVNEVIQKFPMNSKKLWYNIASTSYDENHFSKEILPKIFRQALFFRTHRIPILLKYDDNFFKDERWERVIKLINGYISMNNRAPKKEEFRDFSKTFTMFRYVTSKNLVESPSSDWTIEELRDLFQFVREESYETFKMFYESCLMEYKGGKINDF